MADATPTSPPERPAGGPRRRWSRRARLAAWLGLVFGAVLLLASCDLEQVSVAVTTTTDGNDATPGNGVCEMHDGAGDCSLRAAIDEANALEESMVLVSVPPGTYALTEAGSDDDNEGGDLDLAADRAVTLLATGPGVVVDGTGDDRVLDSRGLLALHGVTLSGGGTGGDGGGLRVGGGTAFVGRTTFEGNTAGGAGGGVAVEAGTAILNETTIAGNVAGRAGGGAHVAAGAELELRASTVSGNAVELGTAAGAASLASVDGPPAETLASGSPSAGDRVEGAAAVPPPPTSDGSVPVIVELEVPVAPEPSLSPSEVGRQRARIDATRQQVVDGLGPDGTVTREYETLPYVAADVDPDVVAALQDRPDVRAVHVDELSRPTLAQSIPWIGADEVHQAGVTGSGAVVAVLDTGVDPNHPMTSGKVVAQACFAKGANAGDAVGDCPNGLPTQTGGGAGVPCPWLSLGCAHGTHVASTAAGSAAVHQSAELSGVAPGAGLIAIQVFSRFTGSTTCGAAASCIASYASDQLAALDHVYALRTVHDVAAVNLSLGSGRNTGSCDTDSRTTAIGNLRAAGIATVIAAGNDSYKDALARPGCITAALTVGATGDSSDAVASFSNSDDLLDLLAPGVSITAAYPGGGYATSSGTSMATPHVAGAVAALHAVNPAATVDQLEAALESAGVPVTDTNGLTRPRLDLPGAVATVGGPGRGGGIANEGTLVLAHTTVTQNAAPWGAGLASSGSATLAATIVGAQADGADCGLDAPVVSGGWNLAGDSTCGLAGTGDLVGVAPLLGPLASNGGSNRTHLPVAGSPAVDSIPPGTPARCDATTPKDQRGVARPSGPACDRGAVER